MSHFTVLVIGDDPDKQLAPYHEFECTGENNEYVQDIDITKDVVDSLIKNPDKGLDYALDYYGLSDKVVRSESEVNRKEDHKYGYAIIATDTEGQNYLVKAVNRTNPNCKWDWYVIGGRWGGFFPLKPGAQGKLGSPSTFDKLYGDNRDKSKVDQARKGDIDFDQLRNDAGLKARSRYRRLLHLMRVTELPKVEYKWSDLIDGKIEQFKNLSHEDKRKVYKDQNPICLIDVIRTDPNTNKDDKEFLVFLDYEEYCFSTEEEYVQRHRNQALATYAVVKNSKWYEKGQMGWFGHSTDKMTEDEWLIEFNKLIDETPDNTLLTLVDCHI